MGKDVAIYAETLHVCRSSGGREKLEEAAAAVVEGPVETMVYF